MRKRLIAAYFLDDLVDYWVSFFEVGGEHLSWNE